MYVCMHVCMYVCMYVRTYVCMYTSIYLSISLSLYIYIYIYTIHSSCTYMCMSFCLPAFMNVCKENKEGPPSHDIQVGGRNGNSSKTSFATFTPEETLSLSFDANMHNICCKMRSQQTYRVPKSHNTN